MKSFYKCLTCRDSFETDSIYAFDVFLKCPNCGMTQQVHVNFKYYEVGESTDPDMSPAKRKSDVTLSKLKALKIPVFFAVGRRGSGKTYFFDMIKEDLQKRNKRVLYLYDDCFTMAYVNEKIKRDDIEIILLDESEGLI